MPLTLPYRFDISPVIKLILRGVGLLLLVILAGMVYSLFISHDMRAALHLLVSGLIVAYFGRLFWNNLVGNRGSITKDEVIVEPATLYGIRLHGQTGRFALRDFVAVRVERIPPPVLAQGGPHERVSLKGKDGTPDILIARTSDDSGRALGRELAAALRLPYREESSPY